MDLSVSHLDLHFHYLVFGKMAVKCDKSTKQSELKVQLKGRVLCMEKEMTSEMCEVWPHTKLYTNMTWEH